MEEVAVWVVTAVLRRKDIMVAVMVIGVVLREEVEAPVQSVEMGLGLAVV
jgi:hypothetical protein